MDGFNTTFNMDGTPSKSNFSFIQKNAMDKFKVNSLGLSNDSFNMNEADSSMGSLSGFKSSFDTPSTKLGFSFGLGSGSNGSGFPDAKGGWMDTAGAVYSYGKLGLGIYNAMEQTKNNKFMKKYYKNQMALQRADFANAARSTNEALSSRQKVRVSAKGVNTDSGQGAKEVAQYMKKWGVNETV